MPALSGNPLWLALNRGEYTLAQARAIYIAEHGFSEDEVDRLFESLFASFVLIDGTVELMHELRGLGARLFAITDNVHEIVAHLQREHDFWPLFEQAAVSAELGVLKPDPRMYRHVLELGAIDPTETLFFDDVARNVAGAEAVGMHARVFTDAAKARVDLRELGVDIAERP
nr:HAD family phosphatase [Qipengyuania qiaonensis]